MSIPEEITARTADLIDHLISADLPGRGRIGTLSAAAKAILGRSPTLVAAERLMSSLPARGRKVFICSGWPNRPEVHPDIAETDGPPGAAVLARALREGFGAVPILLFEENLLPAIRPVVEAAGLRALDEAAAAKGAGPLSSAQVAGLMGFPTDIGEARKRASELLAEHEPAAVVVIEKGGMNSRGVIHSLHGEDISGPVAKADVLIEAANEAGFLTIAIGDAGTEAGFGAFAEIIREMPYGKKCNCPCGAGAVPHTAAQVALAASVSNWGATALVACLALLKRDPALLHTPERERQILEAAASAGLTDGLSGWVGTSVDGLPLEVSLAMTELIRTAVLQGLREAG